MEKPYRLNKTDAVVLQQYCREIKTLLDKYSTADPNKPDFMTTVARITFCFNEFSNWVNTAARVDSTD